MKEAGKPHIDRIEQKKADYLAKIAARGIEVDDFGNIKKGKDERRSIEHIKKPPMLMRSNFTNFEDSFEGSIRDMTFVELPHA